MTTGWVANTRAAAPGGPWLLWYRAPAKLWVEALPIGNGRLGAMDFGGIERERIELNEDTLWAGGPYDPNNPDALATLPEARRLVFEGKYDEANKLIGAKMMAKPLRQMPYEPVGALLLSFPEPKTVGNYRRDLDLDTAIARVTYTSGGVKFTREVFSTQVDQVIVVRLTADKPGQISFSVGMETPQKATIQIEAPDTLVLRGVNGSAQGIPGALKFQARVRVVAQGGAQGGDEHTVSVSRADSATLLIAVATSYRNFKDVSGDPEATTVKQIHDAGKESFDALRERHLAEHRRLFRRVEMDLGTTDAAKLPTDERLRNFAAGTDPQLAALYFQFGRYLLISSSRPGCQPANLQGLWNGSMTPPWDSKYTININTEMNYWPAETGNLGECVEPLVAMIMDLTETGARTARVQWGARGWVAHHNTDLWRATAPIDGPTWGFWPTGGAWLCRHLWQHYEFSGDKKILERVYPAMKGAAQFFLDTLVEEPKHHWLVTCPSLSPENRHPFGSSTCAGPTMDMEILRDLFADTRKAAEILGVDPDFRKQLGETRLRLAPLQIGRAGQLQEWLEDWDLEAPEIHHRHVSHLYGLFPGDKINVFDTPELATAARRSLELRGDEATGWGMGWRLNLWARLQDGEHAYRILTLLLAPVGGVGIEYGRGGGVYPNLFDAHPPFQIDGNFGGTAGIAEMLMHSRPVESETGKPKFEIELLPALPKAWPDGWVRGLRASGGFEVDLDWKDGKMTSATLHSIAGNPCRLRFSGVTCELNARKEKTLRWNGQSGNL